MYNLIGLCGKARSGKDTVGMYLKQYYGYHTASFATPLKVAYYNLNPDVFVTNSELETLKINHLVHYTEPEFVFEGGILIRVRPVVDVLGWDNAKSIAEVRRGLQRMGTEAGRDVHGENCWVNLLRPTLAKYEKVVVTDVRFPNEIKFIKENGGFVAQIIRPGVEAVNAHSSENDIPSELIHDIILNDSTLEDLYAEVESVMG